MVKRKIFSGQPEEFDVFETVAKETGSIKVRVEKRTYGKVVTIIEGVDPSTVDVKHLLKELKRKLGCGGSYDKEKKTLELQGDHRNKIKKILSSLGFSEDLIEIE